MTKMRLSGKLIGLFLLLGITPLVVVSMLLDVQANLAFQDKAFSQLASVRDTQKANVEGYFKKIISDISILAESVAVADVLELAHRVFHEAARAGKKIGDRAWQNEMHGPQAVWLAKYMKTHGYYDLILMDEDGHVVFTGQREADLGESVVQGALQDTGLARLFSSAKSGVVLEDFAPYAPSGEAQAAFIGAPIERDGKFLGVLALQLSTDKINAMMTKRAWLGNTAETYLVGKVGETSVYRSDRTLKEGRIGQVRSGPFIERALTGDSGSDFKTGSTGLPELVTFAPLDIPGLHWAVIITVSEAETFKTLNTLNQSIWVLAALCTLVVVWVGWFFSRTISRPLREVVNIISASSAQMSAALTEQERIATQQAASINETNTTMEELGASARQSSEQAESAANGADKALELSQFGMSRVEETLANMEATKERVEAIAQQILMLSEKTGQIREITSLVSDFANETKMLAMNAAVEAVRAGEHGKGFSVLAVETRKLADESKRSAGRINLLVAEIQKATDSTVMATEEGGKTVEAGMVITRNTAETFREVEQTMNAASQGSQQISLNIRQQSVAIRQVVEAIQSVHTGAKESSKGVSQIKIGIQTLDSAAQTLKSMI